MQDGGAFDIRKATAADVDAIFAIAEELGQDSDPSKGFLVSGYNRSDYQRFVDCSSVEPGSFKEINVTFLVATQDQRVVGFLLAYDLNYILSDESLYKPHPDIPLRSLVQSSEAEIIGRFGDEANFFVVKQLAIQPDFASHGVASRLYEVFFEGAMTWRHMAHGAKTSKTYRNFDPDLVDVFVAVMSRPFNERSLNFHLDRGFLPVHAWSSGEVGGDQMRTRVVLHATAQEYVGAKGVAAKPGGKISDERIQSLFQALEHARTLYTHEDNLNWTKLTYASQYISLLVAGQFVVASFENAPEFLRLIGIVVLSVLSLLLAGQVRTMLTSGGLFMARHKRSALIMESKLNHTLTGFHPSIAGVPLQSATVQRLQRMRIYFQVIVVTSSILSAGLVLYSLALSG